MTPEDVLRSALEAENAGIPVDWKALAFKINTAYAQELARMKAEEEDDD